MCSTKLLSHRNIVDILIQIEDGAADYLEQVFIATYHLSQNG